MSNKQMGFIEISVGIIRVLGFNAAYLLTHLIDCLESGGDPAETESEGYQLIKDEDGKVWCRQSYECLIRNIYLPRHTLMRTKKFLEQEGLIEVRQGVTNEWRIIEDKVTRLYQFASMFHPANAPVNEDSFPKWEAWKKEHPKIVKEFWHLAKGMDKLKLRTWSETYFH